MAFNFVAASSQSIRGGSSPVSGVPFSVAFWVYANDVRTSDKGICIENTAANSRFSVGANMIVGALSRYAYAQSLSSSAAFSDATTGNNSITDNTMVHIAGVFSANNSRKIYLNGTTSSSNSSTQNVGALNSINFAESRIPAYPGYGDCQLSESGVWSVALTDDEVASLAKGFKPTRVRPQSLVFYAPLVRDLQDVRGGLALTNNNTATVAEHPRVY